MVLRENMLTQELADVFAEDSSSDDGVFYGFSDQDLNIKILKMKPSQDVFIKEEKSNSKTPFRLRVALRSSAAAAQWSTEDEDVEEENKTHETVVRKNKEGQVKSEDAAALQTEERGFDSDEDAKDSFLAKREKNIKANKEMVNKHKSTHTVTKYVKCKHSASK